MTLQEALDFIKAEAAKGPDQLRQVTEGLQATAPTVWQPVYQAGFNAANAKAQEKITAADAAKAAAEASLQTAQTTITELQGKAPGAEQLRTQFQTALDAQKAEADKRLIKEQQGRQADRERFVRHLVSTELLDLGVPQLLVDAAVNKPELVKRFDFDGDGNPVPLAKDSAVPIVSPDKKKSPVRILAEELAAPIPKDYIKPRVADSGSGTGAGGGGESANLVDQMIANNSKRASAPNPLKPAAAPAPVTHAVPTP